MFLLISPIYSASSIVGDSSGSKPFKLNELDGPEFDIKQANFS